MWSPAVGLLKSNSPGYKITKSSLLLQTTGHGVLVLSFLTRNPLTHGVFCRMGYGARLLPDLPHSIIKERWTLYQLDCRWMMSYTDPNIISSYWLSLLIYCSPFMTSLFFFSPIALSLPDTKCLRYICLGTYERSLGDLRSSRSYVPRSESVTYWYEQSFRSLSLLR